VRGRRWVRVRVRVRVVRRSREGGAHLDLDITPDAA
jgi:hypothetical protein